MIPHEEKQTVKWYLLISYILIIGWDVFYYYFNPKYIEKHEVIGLPDLWKLNYIVLLLILFIAYYFNKVKKQNWIKYVFIISYLSVSCLVDIVTFHGDNDGYTSGNVVEIFLILSLPIFLNTKYFWLVTLGVTLKYIATGILLKTSLVVVPIVLIAILSGLSFFLLVRFQGYVRALSSSYDDQLEGIVKGVIATLELKDPYTRGHSERVAKYALMFANEVGKFSKEEQKSFYYACLLHDIGKVNIPDQILMKPGKLTNEEFEIIKSHPVVGAEAVKNVEGIKNSIYVIRSHHERWDGKGYPDQLKGEEIPLLARVSAIADAFDAMTSSRSYRDALPYEEAYNRIIQGQGSQFDPMLVEKFKKIFPAWIKFHQNYPWSEKWELLREVEE
ncbi:HD-GYP domain-containing protein [Neobacillus niacini]|uniref:HD-GYP domain-containing protein n=1 Tax=Neobacillus niacini TaxID=86668 RepID=UPI00052F7A39|nr:HD-GYP domain-containing protein [Neobacillus niacini]KGM44618.1 metal-dependent phosphohydrolase [Neobacillus niacini]MEC1522367.1 HD-GYP domain-containing protein [Neobacillus niacini]